MKKIKIAFLVEVFPPAKPGGVAVWAYHLCKNLAEMDNVEVTVFIKKRKWHYSEEWFADTKFDIYPMKGRNWRKFRYWFIYFPLKKYLQKNPDAFVFSSNWEMSEPIVKLRKKQHLPLLTAVHGLEVTRYLNNNKMKQRIIHTLNNSDLVCPVSDFTKNETLAIDGLYENLFKTINIGGDSEKFFPDKSKINETKTKFKIPRDSKVILTLARVIERKGHDIVIKAMPKILESIPNAYYVIAGNINKEFKQKLDKIINDNKLQDRIIFTGLISEEDKFYLYNASDVYIMVSRYDPITKDSEGFGITFIEANLCGLPVVGSRCGGITDAVEDGVSGLLVEQESPTQTANAIISILSNDELYHKLSKNARKRALEGYTWQSVTKKYFDEIVKIIDN